jgi:hypothetical protein
MTVVLVYKKVAQNRQIKSVIKFNRELTAKVSTRINVCSVLQFNLVALAELICTNEIKII